jgi:exosortase/archaeosortase
MIGLIFLSVFIIWILFSVYIGIKIPIWCKSKHPKTMALLCIPLVFFAPVADEIIAYPQMMALCSDAGKYVYIGGHTQETVMNRTVKTETIREAKIIFPFVEIEIGTDILRDATTNEKLLSYKTVEPINSFSAFSTGGRRTTLLLGHCGYAGSEQGRKNKEFEETILKLKSI